MATYTKRGTRWLAQVRRKGHPSLNQTFATKLQAVDWAVEQEARILRGDASCRGGQRTVRDILKRYLETITPGKRSSETERYRLLKLSKDSLCDLPLRKLTSKHIADYRDRRAKLVGSGTICRELSLLHHMFELARREWGVPLFSNPVSDVSKPRLNNARARRLKPGEWEALSASLERSRNPLVIALVTFAVETAMRRGEILDLTWPQIDFQASTAFIPRTKTNRPRTIPLTPAATQLLQALPRDCERVFPLSANAAKLAWVRAVKRAGIHNLRFHDLRHEGITRFFELGLSLPEVALISGHRDPRMLMRYTHLQAGDLARKLSAIIISSK